MKIIINADDFGANEQVNAAIAEAFEKGWITNTTIMTNMPGFDHAVALSKEKGFFDKVGIHLNFFEGVPLTDPILHDALFCVNGEMTSYNLFHKASRLKRFFLSKKSRNALREEAEAQFLKYEQAGFPEFHLDSHGHSHTIPSVYFSIRNSIRNHAFKTVRKSLNLYLCRSAPVKLYKQLCNGMIQRDFRTTAYFTSAREFLDVIGSGFDDKDAVCEIMVHPVYENGELVNAGSIGFAELFDFLEEHALMSYAEL